MNLLGILMGGGDGAPLEILRGTAPTMGAVLDRAA